MPARRSFLQGPQDGPQEVFVEFDVQELIQPSARIASDMQGVAGATFNFDPCRCSTNDHMMSRGTGYPLQLGREGTTVCLAPTPEASPAGPAQPVLELRTHF